MISHLGADLAALVDCELDHPSRERVLRHLTRCQDCRTEVTAQRAFKRQLRAVAAVPALPADLTARLCALAATAEPAAGLQALGLRRSISGRRVALGGAVVALGLGAVLGIAGAHRDPVRTPDPRTLLVDDAGPDTGPPRPQLASVGGLSR